MTGHIRHDLATGFTISKPVEADPTYATDIVQWRAAVTATANVLEYYQPFNREEWLQRCRFYS